MRPVIVRLDVGENDGLLEAGLSPVNALQPGVDIRVVVSDGTNVALSESESLGKDRSVIRSRTLKCP